MSSSPQHVEPDPPLRPMWSLIMYEPLEVQFLSTVADLGFLVATGPVAPTLAAMAKHRLMIKLATDNVERLGAALTVAGMQAVCARLDKLVKSDSEAAP